VPGSTAGRELAGADIVGGDLICFARDNGVGVDPACSHKPFARASISTVPTASPAEELRYTYP